MAENGLFLIKDEKFEVKDGELTITYKACGDTGYAKEYMFMKTQTILDRMPKGYRITGDVNYIYP